MSQTLVLDTSYRPIDVCSWERAIVLFYLDKVEILESYDKTIRSVNFEIRMPSVVRFFRVTRSKNRAIRFSRENVLLRDKNTCQYCGNKIDKDNFSYDHIIPKSQGGISSWTNTVICCLKCNQYKGGRTPEQANMKLLSIPKKPDKLPEIVRFCLTWQSGLPKNWVNWLTDVSYWHGTLEEDT